MHQVQQQPIPMQPEGAHPAYMGPLHVIKNFHSVQKALSLPVVEAAVSQASNLYCAAKESHPLVCWALKTAERTAEAAACSATPIVASLASPLACPIQKADAKLTAGLQILEDKVPLVKEPPEVVYATAKEAVQTQVSEVCESATRAATSLTRAATSLRDLSWGAVNEVLATPTGQRAIGGVDCGAAMAQNLLDYYLPAQKSNDAQPPEIVSAGADPALHAVQTVSRLSARVAGRLAATILRYVGELRTTHDPARYFATLLSLLHLTRVLEQYQARVAEPTNQQAPAEQPQSAAQRERRTPTPQPERKTATPQPERKMPTPQCDRKTPTPQRERKVPTPQSAAQCLQ